MSSDHTDESSEDKLNFPFLTTPSGNLKVIPQQVVYESKQLSIVAADPRKTKVNIKSDGARKDMSGIEKNLFAMEMLAKMPPPPSRMSRQPHGFATGDSLRDDPDLFLDHGRQNTERGGAPADKKQPVNRPVTKFHKEISLTRFASKDVEIDWEKFEMPAKTHLHKLIHYRISNYINPDVLVKIGNHEYRCHSLVLQCYSAYFVEHAASRVELSEKSVTQLAFTNIYDWMLHLGENSHELLRRDNILEIFMAAQYLQVKELEEQCWAFIDNEDLLSEDKAFLLYLDARTMGNPAIMELMVPRIQRFFLTLVASKEFLHLSVEEVSVFLRSNYICIHCEMEVFMSAVRWLVYEWEKRQKYLVEVMSCVRFGLISPWQLVDIRRNPENQEFIMVTRNPDVSGMIEEGLAYAILRYWHANDSSEYRQWIETLGLTEPAARNWAGTQKVSEQQKYTTYREFLVDLADYRRVHVATMGGTGDTTSECEERRDPSGPEDSSPTRQHPRT